MSHVTLSRYAYVASVWGHKNANVTPSQCQKNANCDAIWVLSGTRGNQFLAFKGAGNEDFLFLNAKQS